MSTLKQKVALETTFDLYVVSELLGQGGAGRVYGGVSGDGSPVAVKVLDAARASTDKRARFKNELFFLLRNRHRNIVSVIDHGVALKGAIEGPFYVMPRYHGSLRDLLRGQIEPSQVLPLFSQILDGVEAAHLQNVVHRDLKPENVLYDGQSMLSIADFGIARFTEDIVATLVETSPAQRLANFQYAAPEQRSPGRDIGVPADVYALGLLLNEMCTGIVPHGTEYQLIAKISEEFAYLDDLVARMLRQRPEDRPSTIAEVKGLIQTYEAEAVSLQRLSALEDRVIPAFEVDEPLAHESPRLVSADWDGRRLILTLDRAVTPAWVSALQQMGSFTAVMGRGPDTFSFEGKVASVAAAEHEVQAIIDHFKGWLPIATRTLRYQLEQTAKQRVEKQRQELRQARDAEERRLRVLRSLKI